VKSQQTTLQTISQALLALSVLAAVAAGVLARALPGEDWPPGLLLGVALASTVVSLARTLPAQNIFMAGLLILGIAGGIQMLGATTGIPFGPVVFMDSLGEKMFNVLPWTAPLLWVVIMLNCRGVARLILRPWRKLRTYGFRVIGLTCALVVLFDFGLEPFATRLNHYWFWEVSGKNTGWFGAPWVNFLGWGVTALFILAFLTPWLINKKPVSHHPPDFHPLVMWSALNLFLVADLALHALWLPAVFTSAVTVAGATSAWRNAT
jgi:putative membrane protein